MGLGLGLGLGSRLGSAATGLGLDVLTHRGLRVREPGEELWHHAPPRACGGAREARVELRGELLLRG